MIKKITFSLIAILVFTPFIFAVNGEMVSDCDSNRLYILEDCKVENCEFYLRYGVFEEGDQSGISSEGYVLSGLFGTFHSSDLERDPNGFINYTEWILKSDIPLLSSSQTYYDQLFCSITPFDTSNCEVFYTTMYNEIEPCTSNATKSTDTLYFEVDQNTTVEFDLIPPDNSCIDECLLDYSVDKLGLLEKGDGCLLNYTPGNDFCGEEHLIFYYINDEGEVVNQCAVINVVCDPVEFEVYFDGICDKQTGDYEPFFIAESLNDGQIIEWRLCDSEEWTALNFEGADTFLTAHPGLIWKHFDLPHCIQYRDPENPNAIVTRTFDGCTYLPLISEDNFDVTREFVCNNGANLFRGIVNISPKDIPFGNIYWDYCDCTGTPDEPFCQNWKLATPMGGGDVRIETPLLPLEKDFCIKIVDGNSVYQIERKEYGTGVIICQKFLAIELLNFEGRKVHNANELVWNVATEKNNDYYILEKSEDGIHFSELVKIKSQGSRNQLMTYDYKDLNPDHINYYRLISVDEMGNEEIVSDVIRVEQDKLVDLTVFPNPTKGQFEIEYKSDAVQDIQVEVFDVAGKLIITERLKTIVGTNNYPLNINQYPNGTYFVKIINDNAIFVRKVLKN